MNFETQVKMALAQQGKTLLRAQVDKSYAEHRPAMVVSQHTLRWAAAAFLAFALAAFWFVRIPGKLPPDQLFSQNFRALEPSAFRGSVYANPVWERALADYDQKKYKSAVELFKKALQDTSFKGKDAAYLYLGLSFLADREPAAASNAFQQVGENSLLHPDAQWYEALAALAANDPSRAKVLLTVIAKDDSHHQQKRADKMLKRLK